MVPKLSVIVTVYNKKEYLSRCLDSVIDNNLTDYELILVDDGSKDGSDLICDEYASRYSHIKVLHQQNRGLAGARKTGARVANSAYITFVDADDWIEKDTYTKSFELSRLYTDVFPDIIVEGLSDIYGDKITKCDNKIPSGLYTHEDCIEKLIPYNLFDNKFCTRILNSVCVKIIKKTLFLDICDNLPDSIFLNEDTLFTILLFQKAETLVCLNEVTGYQYCHEVSESLKYDYSYFKKVISYYEILDRVLGDELKVKYKKKLCSDYAYFLSMTINGILFSNDSSKSLKKRIEQVIEICNTKIAIGVTVSDIVCSELQVSRVLKGILICAQKDNPALWRAFYIIFKPFLKLRLFWGIRS